MAKSKRKAPHKKAARVRSIARPFTPDALLKRGIRRHLTRLGFTKANDGSLILPGSSKDIVRRLHGSQRADRVQGSSPFIERVSSKLLHHFADGKEIDPEKIQLKLIRVHSDTTESDLFRFATLTWSVPVSAGFGRRLRYLVWDEGHDRLVGVVALGDPVFNLSVRDNLIGWDASDRSDRLVSILDAYVLGAVPPYNMLLGGKAVACLIRSREIFEDFKRTYGNSTGIISGRRKRAELLAVTTTSSMGRSSVYNRLQLGGQYFLRPIGYTVATLFLVTRKIKIRHSAEIRHDRMILDGKHVFWAEHIGRNWPQLQKIDDDPNRMVIAGICGTRHVEYMTANRIGDKDRTPEVLAADLQAAMQQLWGRTELDFG